MLPFVVIFLLLGLVLTMVGDKFERAAKRTAAWPEVDGQLEYCDVVESPGTQIGDLSTWHLKLRYSYEVKGRTYHSTRYAITYSGSSDDQKHRQIRDGLKRSPHLSVYYDPLHPSEAVLSTEAQTNLRQLGYGCLVAAAVSVLIGLIKGW